MFWIFLKYSEDSGNKNEELVGIISRHQCSLHAKVDHSLLDELVAMFAISQSLLMGHMKNTMYQSIL